MTQATEKQIELLHQLVGCWKEARYDGITEGARNLYDNGCIVDIPTELLSVFFDDTKELVSEIIEKSMLRGVVDLTASTAVIAMIVAQCFYNLGMLDASIGARIALGGIKFDDDGED